MQMELNVNGENFSVDVPEMKPLARVLREDLHLTGTKLPCGEGFCGGCKVFVDDEAVVSCLIPARAAENTEIRTIESIAPPRAPLSPIQESLKNVDAVQCGMCFPGMIVSITEMLEQTPQPTREEVQTALVGNICRCTGYERIVDGVMQLSERTAK